MDKKSANAGKNQLRLSTLSMTVWRSTRGDARKIRQITDMLIENEPLVAKKRQDGS